MKEIENKCGKTTTITRNKVRIGMASNNSSTKKPSFNKNCYLSKNELLSWINDLLKVNLTLVEQLGSGSIYCQIMDVIFPGQISLNKVKWNAKLEYDFLHNFKILQACFDKMAVPKAIPVNKLAKAKYQDNLEFAQWLKAYFDFTCKEKGKGYDAVKRRGNAVPCFAFCKGGALPSKTLFYRNPNEKFTVEEFSSGSFYDPDNYNQEDNSESAPLNVFHNNNFDPNNFQTNQYQTNSNQKTMQFFSEAPKKSMNIIESQMSLTRSPSAVNFFDRGDTNDGKNAASIKQQYSSPSNMFLNKQSSLNSIFDKDEDKQKSQQQQEKALPRAFSFFKQDEEEKRAKNQQEANCQIGSSNMIGINNNIIINNLNIHQTNCNNNNQLSSQNNNITSPSSNFFDQKSDIKVNPSVQSEINSNAPSGQKIEKKASSYTTNSLLSKIQELTEASQYLLKKNGSEFKENIFKQQKIDVNQNEKLEQKNDNQMQSDQKQLITGIQERKTSLSTTKTPQAKDRTRDEGEVNWNFETPISKKLKDNQHNAINSVNNKDDNINQNTNNNNKPKEEEHNSNRNQEKFEKIKLLVEQFEVGGDYDQVIAKILEVCKCL